MGGANKGGARVVNEQCERLVRWCKRKYRGGAGVGQFDGGSEAVRRRFGGG